MICTGPHLAMVSLKILAYFSQVGTFQVVHQTTTEKYLKDGLHVGPHTTDAWKVVAQDTNFQGADFTNAVADGLGKLKNQWVGHHSRDNWV